MRSRCLAFLLPALLLPQVHAAPPAVRVRFEIERLPRGTAADAPLSLAANANGWDPGAAGWAFGRGEGGAAALEVELPRGTLLLYKVARGGWPAVETRADGLALENRALDVLGPLTVRLSVERWADAPGAPAPRPTRTGTIERLAGVASPQLGNRRDVQVWLPPGYARSARRYPVLYLHDGQNVFDAATAFVQQEWRADEAALASARAGRPLIVVAVDAVDTQPGGGRLAELSPFPIPRLGVEGRGARYAAFLAETLKPLVDARYRTLPDRAHTGLAGASLGGLVSLHAALERPDVWGFAGVFSPSLWVGDGAIFPWAAARPPGPAVRLWLDTGDREGDNLDQAEAGVEAARRLAGLLRLAGHDVRFEVVPGGRHNENAWAARFPRALDCFLAGSAP